MGFFSSIKKLFTGTTSETPETSVLESENGLGNARPQSADSEATPDTIPSAPITEAATAATPIADEAESAMPAVEKIAPVAPVTEASSTAAATAGVATTPEQNAEKASASAPQIPTEPTHEAVLQPLVTAPVPASTIGESTVPSASAQPAQAVSTSTSPDAAMTLALRNAEPKLSAWLHIVLEGVTVADDLLWSRIRFLLQSLEAPQEEIDSFVAKMAFWVDDMGYEQLIDFRSELQYRLALALDLEDEEDEKSRLVLKFSEGLAKTRAQITQSLNLLFVAGRKIDQSLWDDLEETLIMADVGYEAASALTEKLRKRAEADGVTDASLLRTLMKEEILAAFKPHKRITAVNSPEVILMIGVNGVGKTTTIAKLCHRATLQGKKPLLAAADTFRAAATEQLEVWAQRTGAGFYAKGHGADPAAVAFEAMEIALKQGYDPVFIDTAGRLHTKTNLMEELTKIRKVIGKQHEGAPHRTILVLDATTGQNGLSQVKSFDKSCGIDELIITKLDGTAKGGIALAAAMQFNIPISFVGLGEKMEDLRPFDADSFVTALLSE